MSANAPGSLIGDGVVAGITRQEVEQDHFSSGGDAMVQDLTLRDLISNFTTVPKGEWVRSSEDPGGPCTAKLLEQLAKDIKYNPELDVWLKRTPGGVKALEAFIYCKVQREIHIDVKIVHEYLVRTNRTVNAFKEELFTDLSGIRKWLDDKAIVIFRFTGKQIDSFVFYSTI